MGLSPAKVSPNAERRFGSLCRPQKTNDSVWRNSHVHGSDGSAFPGTFSALIRQQKRGRLKVYLGFAPGVGKTYDMLQEAQRIKTTGDRMSSSPSSNHTAGLRPRH